MFNLFILFATVLTPGGPTEHTHTLKMPHLYGSEEICQHAAANTGFSKEPKLERLLVSFKCVNVEPAEIKKTDKTKEFIT